MIKNPIFKYIDNPDIIYIQFLKLESQLFRCKSVFVKTIVPEDSVKYFNISSTKPVSTFKDHLQ